MTPYRAGCRLLALLGLVTSIGCGGKALGSKLETETRDSPEGMITSARATWKYVSREVDVVAQLVSSWGDGFCETSARLTIDSLTAAKEIYELERTDCSELALTESGDIVLHGTTTGHDWSRSRCGSIPSAR